MKITSRDIVLEVIDYNYFISQFYSTDNKIDTFVSLNLTDNDFNTYDFYLYETDELNEGQFVHAEKMKHKLFVKVYNAIMSKKNNQQHDEKITFIDNIDENTSKAIMKSNLMRKLSLQCNAKKNNYINKR